MDVAPTVTKLDVAIAACHALQVGALQGCHTMLRIARGVCWTLSVPFFATCARLLEKSVSASHRITQKHRNFSR